MADEARLYALAIYDDSAQRKLDSLRAHMIAGGFVGEQTTGIPHHITLCSLPLAMRFQVMEMLERVRRIPEFEVSVEKIGNFADRVLFVEPYLNNELSMLKNLFGNDADWAAHTTMFLSDNGGALSAKSHLAQAFAPFRAQIVAVELYEFFPSKFLGRADLEGAK